MKKVEITELMDNYTDKEFFFEDTEDSSGTDSKGVKARVMSRVKPFTVKKRIKITAAAAAAAAVLSAAAVAVNSGIFLGSYKTASGITVGIHYGGIKVNYASGNEPFEYRDGRVIFTASGEDKDITDLIDYQTPYIYSYKNEAGLESYLIIGGDPGTTAGFMDISNIGTEEEPIWQNVGMFQKWESFEVYGVNLAYIGLTDIQLTRLEESDLTHQPRMSEDGSVGYSMEEYEKRFVKTSWDDCKIADWVRTAADRLNFYEAKDRMCNLFFPDISYTDEEFLSVLCGNSLSIPSGVWYRSLETLGEYYDVSAAYESPIEERDGRLWAKVNGTEKDITDLVSENTPYIEALDRPADLDEGYGRYEAYLIVGGTPGNYKYTELINNAKGSTTGDLINRSDFIAFGDEVYSYTLTVDGEPIEWEQLIESLEQGIDLTGRFNCETHWEPWYKAACEKLNIGYNVLYVK